MSLSVGLLLVRVLIGALFIGHGTQKLFGWFGGHGPSGTGGWLESLGFRRGRFWAVVTGVTEATAGSLLILGFLTPLAAAAMVGVMAVATMAVHWRNGVWVSSGGFELPLVYATVATALAMTGPGAYSLERALDWSLDDVFGFDVARWQYGVGALALGALSGVAVELLRRRAPAAAAEEQPQERARAA